MSIWKQLYAMVWIAFLQILLGAIEVPGFRQYLLDGHIILGFVILGLAHYNNVQIKKTTTPSRLKRIAKATAILATIQPVLGIIILTSLMMGLNIPFVGVIVDLHLIIALAIITQAASVATAYDMWEDKEFTSTA